MQPDPDLLPIKRAFMPQSQRLRLCFSFLCHPTITSLICGTSIYSYSTHFSVWAFKVKNNITFSSGKSQNETSVSPDAVWRQLGVYTHTNLQLEQLASTAESTRPVLYMTSDLPVEGEGTITHHHFTQVEPHVDVKVKEKKRGYKVWKTDNYHALMVFCKLKCSNLSLLITVVLVFQYRRDSSFDLGLWLTNNPILNSSSN